MKEIRTRPKGRDIQTRQTTAFLPKQAAKVLRENAARRQLTAKNTEQQEEAQSVFSEPASRFETTAQRAAEISARTAFRSGKALAQKQFDRAVISTKPKERVENAAPLRQSDPPQVMRAKQQFRQEQAKKQTERRRETVVREAKQEAFRVQDDFALQEHRFDEAQIRAMLAAMPKDVSAQRKAVVEKAYSLLGKVNYFWGGKSSAIGWDSRWGTPTRVTAPGSRSTGTVRPYGLDCSGFVDWVFNNSLGYVIGHGGGAASQHGYCKPISWSEALPGDLVFYPGDSHVGIFVGKDESGSPLIIHCASSQNNVVLTGLQGFTSIGRPDCFS